MSLHPDCNHFTKVHSRHNVTSRKFTAPKVKHYWGSPPLPFNVKWHSSMSSFSLPWSDDMYEAKHKNRGAFVIFDRVAFGLTKYTDSVKLKMGARLSHCSFHNIILTSLVRKTVPVFSFMPHSYVVWSGFFQGVFTVWLGHWTVSLKCSGTADLNEIAGSAISRLLVLRAMLFSLLRSALT